MSGSRRKADFRLEGIVLFLLPVVSVLSCGEPQLKGVAVGENREVYFGTQAPQQRAGGSPVDEPSIREDLVTDPEDSGDRSKTETGVKPDTSIELGACAPINQATAGWKVCEAQMEYCAGYFEDGGGCHAYCAAAGMECAGSSNVSGECKPGGLAMTCDASIQQVSAWCECVAVEPICVAHCDGFQCGGDGCGGECGSCEDPMSCSLGLCVLLSDGGYCGDGACGEDEASTSCVEDCGAVCGDGVCNGVEDSSLCSMDCGGSCGDGACNGDESSFGCVEDCGAHCGDFVCNGGETTVNCPTDCGALCGDGVCNGVEDSGTCTADCGSVCGDGLCNGGEHSGDCPGDCGADCGDGVCNGGESSSNCTSDCGPSSPPAPGLKLIGYIGSAKKVGGKAEVVGWACHPGWGGSIDVHIYAGGSAGQGTIIKGGKADQPNESAVGDACQTQEGSHRFNISLTQDELNAFQGQPIYIHGISPTNSGNELIHNSGVFVVPSA